MTWPRAPKTATSIMNDNPHPGLPGRAAAGLLRPDAQGTRAGGGPQYFWAIQLAMLAFVIWTFATTPASAAHCRAGQLWRIRLGECVSLHSRLAAEVWRSPRRVAYREVAPAPAPPPVSAPAEDDDLTWYVEITKLPPDEPDRSAGIEKLKRALAQ
jgi:hypothetical protein